MERKLDKEKTINSYSNKQYKLYNFLMVVAFIVIALGMFGGAILMLINKQLFTHEINGYTITSIIFSGIGAIGIIIACIGFFIAENPIPTFVGHIASAVSMVALQIIYAIYAFSLGLEETALGSNPFAMGFLYFPFFFTVFMAFICSSQVVLELKLGPKVIGLAIAMILAYFYTVLYSFLFNLGALGQVGEPANIVLIIVVPLVGFLIAELIALIIFFKIFDVDVWGWLNDLGESMIYWLFFGWLWELIISGSKKGGNTSASGELSKLKGKISDALYDTAVTTYSNTSGQYVQDFINIRDNKISVGIKIRKYQGTDDAGLIDTARQEVMSKIKSILNNSDYDGECSISVSAKFY